MKKLLGLLLLLFLCGCGEPLRIRVEDVLRIEGGIMEKIDGRWVVRDCTVILNKDAVLEVDLRRGETDKETR